MTHSPETRTAVLAALRAAPWSVQAIARAFGISHSTVTRWAAKEGVKLPPPDERVAMGALTGTHTLWGEYEVRRKKARRLRAKGATLTEIAAACGLSLSGAHYAVRSYDRK